VQLYFIRHGIAENPSPQKADFDRELSAHGAKELEKAARRLKEIGFHPDLLVTSPLVRARQTAQILAKGLKLEKRLVVDPRLDPGLDVAKLRAVIAEHAEADNFAFVGHEPSLSEVIADLIGGGMVVCGKGGVARVDLEKRESNHGELVWLLHPDALAR